MGKMAASGCPLTLKQQGTANSTKLVVYILVSLVNQSDIPSSFSLQCYVRVFKINRNGILLMVYCNLVKAVQVLDVPPGCKQPTHLQLEPGSYKILPRGPSVAVGKKLAQTMPFLSEHQCPKSRLPSLKPPICVIPSQIPEIYYPSSRSG